MSGLSVTTDPSSEPLTSAETISYLRLDSGVDTTLVGNLIKEARVWTENILAMTTQKALGPPATIMLIRLESQQGLCCVMVDHGPLICGTPTA
jgi:hypothetical protein